jgi:hypothetical protein
VFKFLGNFVADWNFLIWELDGNPVVQVEVILFNGQTHILDYYDFMLLSEYEASVEC